MFKDIMHYYILALIIIGVNLLLVATGVVTWLAGLPFLLMFVLQILIYGTVLLIADKILHKVLGLK
jgi:hypothetical protein